MTMSPNDPLIAAPRGTLEEALEFFRKIDTKRTEHVNLYLATVYDIAPQVKIDPAILVAHASHETDYFRSYWWEKRLNPAGLGITGTRSQDIKSKKFPNGACSALAHTAHMQLYATGKITEPLSNDDDPRYQAYFDEYGTGKQADTIKDLTGKWAQDPKFHLGVVRHGNEIFSSLPNPVEEEIEKPQIKPSPIFYQGKLWDGTQSVWINGHLFRAVRRKVTVNVNALNLRKYADTTSPILSTVSRGTTIDVLGYVRGERVGAEDRWWIGKDYTRIWVGGTSEKP